MMATTAVTPREVVTEYFEALGAQDLDRAVATWEPGSLDRLHGFAEVVAPEGIRDYFGGIFAAIPDFRLEVTSTVTEDDQVAVRWRATGTFDGAGKFEGLAPNGRRVELEGIDLLTVSDGKNVGNDAHTNGREFGRPVGAPPPRGSTQERGMAAGFNARTIIAKRLRRS